MRMFVSYPVKLKTILKKCERSVNHNIFDKELSGEIYDMTGINLFGARIGHNEVTGDL